MYSNASHFLLISLRINFFVTSFRNSKHYHIFLPISGVILANFAFSSFSPHLLTLAVGSVSSYNLGQVIQWLCGEDRGIQHEKDQYLNTGTLTLGKLSDLFDIGRVT